MENCLFCKIVKGDIPSTKVYEDELVLAFRDIAPQAPTHVLVIPKEHISGVGAVTAEHAAIAGHCIAVCAKVAELEAAKAGVEAELAAAEAAQADLEGQLAAAAAQIESLSVAPASEP